MKYKDRIRRRDFMKTGVMAMAASGLRGQSLLPSANDRALRKLARGESSTRDTVLMENSSLQISLRQNHGEFQILHKPTRQVWLGPRGRLCSMVLTSREGKCVTTAADRFEKVVVEKTQIRLIHSPAEDLAAGEAWQVEFKLALAEGGHILELGHQVLKKDSNWSVDSVRMIDDALPISGQSDYAVLPVQQGVVVPVGIMVRVV